MRSFVKIKSSRIGEISLPFTDISKSRPCHEFSTLQICILTLLAKIWCLVCAISLFRSFVFSPGVMARRQDEITPSEKTK